MRSDWCIFFMPTTRNVHTMWIKRCTIITVHAEKTTIGRRPCVSLCRLSVRVVRPKQRWTKNSGVCCSSGRAFFFKGHWTVRLTGAPDQGIWPDPGQVRCKKLMSGPGPVRFSGPEYLRDPVRYFVASDCSGPLCFLLSNRLGATGLEPDYGCDQ